MALSPQDRAPRSQGDHPVSRVDTRVIVRDRAVRAEMQPRMAALRAHLSAFVAHARAEPIAAVMDYVIDGVGTLRTHGLRDLRLSADDWEHPEEVALRFEAHGGTDLKVLPPGSEEYFALRTFLYANHLSFTSGIAATVCKITLKPVVPVAIVFRADVRRGAVRLDTSNMAGLGVEAYKIRAQRLDAPCMEAMTHGIAHDPVTFHMVCAAAAAAR